ncbi:TPA: PqiA/YebS family transporter subunit [Mannheimia haemolytica]
MKINKIILQSCGECGQQVRVPLMLNGNAVCPVCHNILRKNNTWSLRRSAFLALAILILLPFALHFPLMSIDLLGIKINATVWDGIWKMATEGYPYTAFMVLVCAVIMPIAFVLLILTVQLQRIIRQRPRYTLIFLSKIKEWVMLDVYLVALAVAAFKIRDYADLQFDVNLIAFVLVTLLNTLLFIKTDPKQAWERFYPEYHSLPFDHPSNPTLCPTCEYCFDETILDLKGQQRCPRCESNLSISDNVKIQRVWACLIAGTIMMIPANIFPISTTELAGQVSADSLMSGVLLFMEMGSYTVAAIVFIASIAVPVSKITIIFYLLLAIHYKWKHPIHWQMKLLHYVHFVGRWSMLDLFVLSLMMSLLERGQILSFSVGEAAFYFGAAVFLTMFASANLDARMLWKIHYDHKRK